MPAGRPTKYNEELQEKAEYYVEHWQEVYPEDVIPTQEGLCSYIGININTLRDWHRGERRVKPKFSALINDLNEKQRRILVNSGLGGKFNAKITTLILSQKQHQIIETKHVDQTIDGNITVEREIVSCGR